MLFGCQLPGTTGTPPLKMREYIKQMIAIMECDTPILKERWLGHPSIPLRMFEPRQYLVTAPIQQTKLTKPKVTSKPLPPTSALKLVPKETQSDFEDHRRVKLTGGGHAKSSGKAEVGLINYFVSWFQTISVNTYVEAQKRALSASWEADSSVLANEWYDKGKLDDVKVASARSDQRRVKYSAKIAKIGFPS